MNKRIFSVCAAYLMILLSALGEVGALETKMPVLTVNDMTGGKCSWLPFQYSRKATGESLKVLIADDTPGGSGELIRGCVWIAATTAAMLKNDPLDGVRLTIEFSGDVDGPSAGGVTCLAILLAMEGKTIPSDFAMTGTIMPDGTIGLVGGVAKKIEGAVAKGVKRICIPAFLRWEKQDDGGYLDLFTHCEAKGVKVYPIRTVEEAYKIVTGHEFRKRDPLDEQDILALPGEVDQEIVRECVKYFAIPDRLLESFDHYQEVENVTRFGGFTADLRVLYRYWDAFKRGKMLAALNAATYFRSVYGDYKTDEPMAVWNEIFEITNNPYTAISEVISIGTNKYNNIKGLGHLQTPADDEYLRNATEEQKEKDASEMRRLARMLLGIVLDETSWKSEKDNGEDSGSRAKNECSRGYFPDGGTTDIAAQSEDYDMTPEMAGYFEYYNSYLRRDDNFSVEAIDKMSGKDARGVVQSLLDVYYKTVRFRNRCASNLSCTNRCLIYAKLPPMRIIKTDAEKVASFFFVSTRSIYGVIHADMKNLTEHANVLMRDYEEWMKSKDPHYPVFMKAKQQSTILRLDSAQGKLKNPDYNLSAIIYQDSQVMARACALQVKYSPDMGYDFVLDEISNKGFAYFLIRLARMSALEAIADCKKFGIPCIDPMLRFELADEAMGDSVPDLMHSVLENYWRAYFGAKALVMGFHGIH